MLWNESLSWQHIRRTSRAKLLVSWLALGLLLSLGACEPSKTPEESPEKGQATTEDTPQGMTSEERAANPGSPEAQVAPEGTLGGGEPPNLEDSEERDLMGGEPKGSSPQGTGSPQSQEEK